MKYISSLNENGVRIYDTETKATEYVRADNIKSYDFKDIDGVEVVENRLRFKVSKKHKLYEMKLKLSANIDFNSDNLDIKVILNFDDISATVYRNGRITVSDSECAYYDTTLTIEEYEHYSESSETDDIKAELLNLIKYLDAL